MDIYEPREDSFLLCRQIKDYADGKSVLDMGTGSGILAKEAAKYAVRVIAVDISPAAVEFCRKRYNNIEFRQSDLFSNVPEKFDLIIFNPPYLPSDESIPDIALDGGKGGWELIARFLLDAKSHLKNGGVILLLFSSFSNPQKIKAILKEKNYSFKEVARQHIHFEDLFVYAIS